LEESIVFGEKATVNITIRSDKQGVITVYDIPPPTVKVDGRIVRKHLVNANSILEIRYYVKPLTVGKHTWGNLVIIFEEPNGFFKYIYEYDAPRSLVVYAPKIVAPKARAVAKTLIKTHAPVFSHTKPYNLGDDLRRIIYKSVLSLSGPLVKVFSNEEENIIPALRKLKFAILLGKKSSIKTTSILKYVVYNIALRLFKIGMSLDINGVEICDLEDIEHAFKHKPSSTEEYDVAIVAPDFLQKQVRIKSRALFAIPNYSEHYELFKQLNLPHNYLAQIPEMPNIITVENLDQAIRRILEEVIYGEGYFI